MTTVSSYEVLYNKVHEAEVALMDAIDLISSLHTELIHTRKAVKNNQVELNRLSNGVQRSTVLPTLASASSVSVAASVSSSSMTAVNDIMNILMMLAMKLNHQYLDRKLRMMFGSSLESPQWLERVVWTTSLRLYNHIMTQSIRLTQTS